MDDVSRSQHEVDMLVSLCQADPDFFSPIDQQSAFLCSVLAKAREQIQNEGRIERQNLWPDHKLAQLMASVVVSGSTAPFALSVYYVALRLGTPSHSNCSS